MSAKVLKKEALPALAAFEFPAIGAAAGPPSGAAQSFVFPEINAPRAAASAAAAEPAFDRGAAEEAAGELLAEARAEAARLIAAAEEHSLILHEAAREKALTEARLTFEEEVSSRVAMEVGDLRQRLVTSIDGINGLAKEIADNVEAELLEFALEIAKKIVRREVSMDREVALTLVKISLAKLHNRTFARIHVSPDDANFIDEHRERLGFQGSLEIVADNSISPGGCLVHTETGEIDARLESQFDEIAHGLMGKN